MDEEIDIETFIALKKENKQMKKTIQKLKSALSLGHNTCENLDNNKNEYHGVNEPCPVEVKIAKLLAT